MQSEQRRFLMLRNGLNVQNHDVILWNERFQASLARASSDGSLDDVLNLLSTMFPCDRIYIFQKNQYGTYDCSEEWCAAGIPRKRDIMQNLSEELCRLYYGHYQNDTFLEFTDIENLKESDPNLYTVLKPQGIRSLFSGQLTFAGEDLGFFGMDNPIPEKMPEIASCFSILRFFIAGVIYSRIGKIQKSLMEAKDPLTNAGSWHGLYAAMDRMDQSLSVGLICCNLIGLNNINLARGRQIGDSLLIETSRIIRSVFGSEHTYRIDGDDFIAVVSDISSSYFDRLSDQLKHLLLDSGIAVQFASIWDPAWIGNADTMLDRVRTNLHPLTRYEDVLPASSDSVPANIVLPERETFRHKANVWLRMLSPEDSRIAVIAIDFNHFSLYNSIHGTDAGNKRLEGMSQRLSEYAASFHGTAGYMGGDQFALLLPISDLTRADLEDELRLIAGKAARPIGFAPAFGIFVTGYTNQSFSQLYDRALGALNSIRGKYDRIFSFFDPVTYEQRRRIQLLLEDTPGAVRRGEFTFYLQPRVRLSDLRITSAEAEVRWKKDGFTLPASAFQRDLEENGSIVSVDCYIWDKVFAWQYGLVRRGITPPPAVVSVSQIDFYFTNVSGCFHSLIEDYPMDPSLIKIEISDSTVIAEQTQIQTFLDDARKIGYSITKKDSLAKGVDTKEQADNLQGSSFEEAQGTFYYRPMKPEAYEALLKDTN